MLAIIVKFVLEWRICIKFVIYKIEHFAKIVNALLLTTTFAKRSIVAVLNTPLINIKTSISFWFIKTLSFLTYIYFLLCATWLPRGKI